MRWWRQVHGRTYSRVAGTPPRLKPWHFQWLGSVYLLEDLREILPGLSGAIIDVGTGDKPYRQWIDRDAAYIGVDVREGPGVDVVIEPTRAWPFDSAKFDGALCTQVLEHTTDLEHVLSEIARVLKPGGTLVVSVPFAYPEHGTPHDYRRFSRHEMRRLLEPGYEILDLRLQGATGSTIGLYLLVSLDRQLSAMRGASLIRLPLLPFWLLFSLVVNLGARVVDSLDRSSIAYNNVLVVARRRQTPRAP